MADTWDMDREGAETYLRLLAEAMLRDGPGGGDGLGALNRATRVTAAAGALVAVGVLDAETAATVVAEAELALAVRECDPEPGGSAALVLGPGRLGEVRISQLTAHMRRPGMLKFLLAGPIARSRVVRRGSTPATGGAQAGGAERIVPAGVTIPFRTEDVSGELYLMSFAQTAAGARFHGVYGLHSLSGGPGPDELPATQFGVTDSRGDRYQLEIIRNGGPGWVSIVGVRPEPPAEVAWLEITTPGGSVTRIGLGPDGLATPHVRAVDLSPGETLLTLMAERLLTATPDLPGEIRRRLSLLAPGSLQHMATGFGEIVAALAAADVLPPLSPVPGQLATLCASLGIADHGISAPPAAELPEPWLSLLTFYQRRKTGAHRAPDGFAAVTAALPELDGIRLALLGLENRDGRSSLHVLTRGMTRDSHPGLTGLDFYFPLSVWVRDSGGRWHAGRAASWHPSEGEYAARLHVMPPLPAGTAWIDLVVTGQTAEIRTRLPLRWGYVS
jgi:hypothetical protein